MANEVILNFLEKIGKSSSPNEKTHLGFANGIQQAIWERLLAQIGIGYFRNGFFYLFGDQLTQLTPVLTDWKFLLDAEIEYTLIGINKMGFLILGEDLIKKGMASQISIIDPFHITLHRNPQIKLLNFVGRWLPDEMIPHLNNNRIYEGYLGSSQSKLDFEEIIAIKIPLSLDGSFTAGNFTVEPILEYYKTTGEIYAKTLDKSAQNRQ